MTVKRRVNSLQSWLVVDQGKKGLAMGDLENQIRGLAVVLGIGCSGSHARQKLSKQEGVGGSLRMGV